MPVNVKRPIDRLGRSLVVAKALTRDTCCRPDFEGISFLLEGIFGMLTGRRFKLERATLALENLDGDRRAVTIPSGEILKIVSGPKGEGDRMVDVEWTGKVLTMFRVDVDVRGTEIPDKSCTA